MSLCTLHTVRTEHEDVPGGIFRLKVASAALSDFFVHL